MCGKFCKRHIDAKKIDPINQYLADQRDRQMSADKEPTVADDINIDVPPDSEEEVRNMVQNLEKIWPDQLDEIKKKGFGIDLNLDANRLSPHCAEPEPNKREVGKTEINKQLTNGAIKPEISEWASPVLFAPKKDGLFRICTTKNWTP